MVWWHQADLIFIICFHCIITTYWPLVADQSVISEDSIFLNQVVSDEIRQRELLMDDEEEDFLDECLVNPTGWKIKIHFEKD